MNNLKMRSASCRDALSETGLVKIFVRVLPLTRAQHGMSPSGNLINMHKIGKIASVGFNSQLLANT